MLSWIAYYNEGEASSTDGLNTRGSKEILKHPPSNKKEIKPGMKRRLEAKDDTIKRRAIKLSKVGFSLLKTNPQIVGSNEKMQMELLNRNSLRSKKNIRALSRNRSYPHQHTSPQVVSPDNS